MTIRIGNGAGFWGDNLDAPVSLAREGRLDFLTLEYLAELTMSILAHLRSKDPQTGYITDFPELLARLAPILDEQPKLKIITNAGGLNPIACAASCATILEDAGLAETPIGIVSGDDILPRISELIAEGVDLDHLETGAPITGVASRLVSANVYLGARPIDEALGLGARIVITGRVADASLTLGPAAHEFDWAWDDWDRLAGGSVAGHLIECGAQATGGLWHRWREIDDFAGIGYPIAEIDEAANTLLTKPDGSGGLVAVANVAEQLVYEIDDPRAYRTPDVDVDLTSVNLTQRGTNRVLATGTRGRAPSDKLKVSAVFRDGWTASGVLAVIGRDAVAKAREAGGLVMDRVRRAGFDPADSLVECIGAGDVVPGVIVPKEPPREVMLRVSVRDPRREAVERFCRELAPLITAGPPGIAGYASGRPSPRPAFGYWPTLIPKEFVKPIVAIQRPSRENP